VPDRWDLHPHLLTVRLRLLMYTFVRDY
jgi:hypothetical protein